MADVQRSRSALLTLFANNVTGQISEQDLRDFLVTIMETEFVNPGDFWHKPDKDNITADSMKGWIEYSCIISEALSFCTPVCLKSTGDIWVQADVGAASLYPAIGLAYSEYAASATDAKILRRGIIKNSALSTIFANYNGKPVYLLSIASIASKVGVAATISQILGIVEDASNGIFRFDPEWSVKA
ncbi:MAG: hypothetical protein ACC651_07060 [Candidatus Scalindua sp.]